MGNIIEPININQQSLVKRHTKTQLDKASLIFNTQFDTIPVLFDLKGRSAGMYRVLKRKASIRFNPYIFAKYFDDNVANTIPHEIAHYVTDILYGIKNIRPHGKEWREVMLRLGVEPKVTGQYNLNGIPVRRHQSFSYHCNCSTHHLGIKRHHNVEQGKARYYCKLCENVLTLTPDY